MAQDADSATIPADPPTRPRLHVLCREAMRRRNYSRRTEQSFWFWVRWFIRHNGLRYPSELGATKLEGFLSWLATEREVAAATILNSPRAIEVSAFVVRASLQLREAFASNQELTRRLDELERRVGTHDRSIAEILAAIRALSVPPATPPTRGIGFVQV